MKLGFIKAGFVPGGTELSQPEQQRLELRQLEALACDMKHPISSLHPPPLTGKGNTGGKMKACWATGNGALQEWEACLEVYFSLLLTTNPSGQAYMQVSLPVFDAYFCRQT